MKLNCIFRATGAHQRPRKTWSTGVCTALACLIFSASAPATGAEPALTAGGSITLVSDYLVRGISQTQRKPALQGQLDVGHSSGFYASLFGSGVAQAAYPNGSGVEIDVIGGYRTVLPADLGLDISYNAYIYPGAHTDGDRVRFDTQEVKALVNHGDVNVGVAVATSRYFFAIYGLDAQGEKRDSRGSVYLEANWNPLLSESVTLNLHAGRQRIRGLSAMNFTDYKAGVTFSGKSVGLAGWGASLAWLHNSGDRALWAFADGDGNSKVAVGSRAQASVTYSF